MNRRDILMAYKQGLLTAEEVVQRLKALPPGAPAQAPAPAHALSEGQRGLWWFAKTQPASSAYNVPMCLRVRGPANLAHWQQALDAAVQEHPLLHTVIQEIDGEARMAALGSGQVPLQAHDARTLTPDEITLRLRELIKQPIVLTAGPPMRAHLLHRDDEHWVLLVVHHIVCDGGSMQLLLASLMQAVQALARGEAVQAAPIDTRYADFVAWEQGLLASEQGREHLAYWRGQLALPLPVLELPTDRPRHLSSRTQGHTLSHRVDAALEQRMRAFCATHRLSPAVVLLGAYKQLLRRYSGLDDITVGMPTVGRPQARFERVFGYFINMMPLRSRLDDSESVGSFLRKLQFTLADGMDHAVYPFPALVRELRLPRSDGTPPAFQVAFEYQSASVMGMLFGAGGRSDAPLQLVEGLHQEGEYELVLEAYEMPTGCVLNLKYDPELFGSATAERWVRHLLNLLDSMLADPARTLGQCDMLGAAERQQLLVEWNHTASDYPRHQCAHELIAQQARYTPDAIAVSLGERRLSYRRIDVESDALACHLQAQGVGPGHRVGLCLERSPEMVVGLLAVWKAGAAYVPLDPDYPTQRLHHMLRDSGATCVLTQRSLRERLEPLLPEGCRALCMDDEWQTGQALRPGATPDGVAYVIYTSGSTGLPKGVMVGHRALTNFLASMASLPGLSPSDRLLAVTTLSFDIAGLELYLPLVQGAQCVLASAETARDPMRLWAEIRRVRPTVMQATPATWRMLFQCGWRNEERVRILCGGEALPEALRQEFIATGSEAWNLFGPTETTVWSTLARVTAESAVTIGAPIANTRVYVLDGRREPVPVGVPGELYIGGDGVAQGYLNRPELTAERFIDDLFVPGGKLYRTGDRVRWRDDGQLDYIERIDSQIKLRGHRIELGEIESQLSAHPGVHGAAVVLRDDERGKQLVAYCVAPGMAAVALREHLKQHLPDYMVPAQVVVLDALPLTPAGKVDRQGLAARALPKEDTQDRPQESAGARSLPGSEAEARVLAIWHAVLKTQDAGPTDGFFDSGGDSLLALTLAQRISEQFGQDFSVTDVFRHGNARNMARQLFAAGAAAAPPPLAVAVQPPAAAPHSLAGSLAIIGISCRLPGADDHRAFWANLRHGRESVQLLDEAALRAHGVPEALIRHERFVPVHAGIEGRDLFDHAFFGFSALQAQTMDPQTRLLLQHAWSAVEDAGYAPSDIAEAGVFMATASQGHHLIAGAAATAAGLPYDDYVGWLLAQPGSAPTLVAHKLGLTGPSYAVHANCSSSLVALHTALQAIRAGELRCALVGAATVFSQARVGYVHQKGMNFSADGHVKAFAADADGMVAGEGVVVLLVKEAAQAVADADPIYAIVRGVGLNNDGARKAGYYAPSVQGQREVIDKALRSSGVTAESIGYVEAHGTGTALGDPIEFAALREAYAGAVQVGACGLGSVKTNIGHLDTAAGLAGCLKLALGLQHRQIPPTLHCAQPNPALAIDSSPFFVVDTLRAWPALAGAPRRGALSAFGIGGTNAHAVLEEAPVRATQEGGTEPGSACVVPLSARTDAALKRQAAQLLAFLGEPGPTLRDMAYTLQIGRHAMARRQAFIASSVPELKAQLAAFVQGLATPALAAPALQELVHEKLAHEWAQGASVDWRDLHLHAPRPQRVSLPTYPFEPVPCGLPQGVPVAPTVIAEPEANEALPQPEAASQAHDAERSQAEIERRVAEELARLIGLPAQDIDVHEPFVRYAIDSISSIKLVNQLNQMFATELSVTAVFEHDCVHALAGHLASQGPTPAPTPARPQTERTRSSQALPSSPKPLAAEPVAVISLSGRYPQAATIEQLWGNLAAGRDMVTEVPADRWPLEGFYNPERGDAAQQMKSHCKHGGFLSDIDAFDFEFFGLSAEETQFTNLRELLFLETTWRLLESAGYTRQQLHASCGASVGVFVGAVPGTQHYFGLGSARNAQVPPLSISGIASRVSRHFDLNGPSLAVDTQSSSSLAAVHMACESLARGECQMAIAGGVTLLYPEMYAVFNATGILASKKSSRSFLSGDGAIPAEGVGAVLLKPLARALADGDTVHAVIRSTAMRHAGHAGGSMVPSVQAQTQLIEQVLKTAGVEPRSISCVEAAANGSPLGDAIELAALSQAFRKTTEDLGFCAIGSVKSGMGHAEAASGISQLTKAVLQIKHQQLAPMALEGEINPNLRLAGSPFYLQRSLQPWPRPVLDRHAGETPRRALVNSFGAGGVYVSVLLEEPWAWVPGAPAQPLRQGEVEPAQLIVLSAKDDAALATLVGELSAWVALSDAPLAAVAHTLQACREAHPTRLALVVRHKAELADRLAAFASSAPRNDPPQWHFGRADREAVRRYLDPDAERLVIAKYEQEKHLERLAFYWVNGAKVQWAHINPCTQRVALPGYPLRRQQPGSLPTRPAPSTYATP